MPTVADFTSNPDSFLKNNLFLPFFSPAHAAYRTPGPHMFSLSDDGLTCARKGTGVISQFKTKDVAVWSVRPNIGGKNGVLAYWLPYDQNFQHTIVLESEASVMFTPLMDGCSFGFTDYGGGTFGASHANLQTNEGRADEGQLRQVLRGKAASIHKTDYMTTNRVPGIDDTAKATTIGVRIKNQWHFYYQQFLDNMGTYYLLKVEKIGRR